jgi:hypothetical protein
VRDVQEDDMLRSDTLIDSDTRIATTAIGAGLIVCLTAALILVLTPAVPDAHVAAAERALLDRLPVLAKGPACSQRGWPNYEQSCLFDKRGSADDGRKVRVINFDRQYPAPIE